jgi:hypothetical protein
LIAEALGRDFPARLSPNAVTGELILSRYDPSTRERTTEVIPPGSRWAADTRRVQYGLARFADGRSEFLLVYAGEPAPRPDNPKEWKPAVVVPVYSVDHGIAEFRCVGTIAVGGADRLLDANVVDPGARDGSIAIIEFGNPRPVDYGQGRRFFAPEAIIVTRADREMIPQFAASEAVCPIPGEARSLLAKALQKALAAPAKPKPSLRDELDDEVPFNFSPAKKGDKS